MIRQQFHINPWTLSDERFADLLCEANYLKQLDTELFEAAITRVLNRAFGNTEDS